MHHCIFCWVLLMHAFVDQDFVFLTISTLVTLCSHRYSGNVTEVYGSSIKQLLYFDAGLQRFPIEGARWRCTPWGLCWEAKRMLRGFGVVGCVQS